MSLREGSKSVRAAEPTSASDDTEWRAQAERICAACAEMGSGSFAAQSCMWDFMMSAAGPARNKNDSAPAVPGPIVSSGDWI